MNILQATLLAMRRAVDGLHIRRVVVLVDGNRLLVLDVPHAQAIVKGDSKVSAISAASTSWPRYNAIPLRANQGNPGD